jgi:hypothetical protein
LRLHRAWLVAAVTFLVLLASAAFRSSLGVLLVPIEEDLGWSRTETSIAVSLNLLVYGVAAPFAAALLERVGVRRTAVGALLLIAAGCLLTTVMNAPWQLSVLWGLVIGTATGSVALVFGAIVANRWFVARRGLVVGILGAAWATGQLVFLPLLAALVDAFGWRAASLAVAGTCGLLIPVVAAVLRDRPEDVGLLPYGSTGTETPAAAAGPRDRAGGRRARRDRAPGGVLDPPVPAPGRDVLRLRLDHQRDHQQPLRARRARPRHGSHHRRRAARRRRDLRHRRDHRLGLAHRPDGPPQAPRRLLRPARPGTAGRPRAARP